MIIAILNALAAAFVIFVAFSAASLDPGMSTDEKAAAAAATKSK